MNNSKNNRYPKQFCILMVFYGIVTFLLFLFSYTQVDLNLTLSEVSMWQRIQKAFQYIGYYQRPLSTWIYIGLITALFVLYGYVIVHIRRYPVTSQQVWKLIGFIAVMLVFSYPAFSYDIFNYVFTAKTVLVYHKNPYDIVPQQLSGIDPWPNFMRWTHLPSAYTPLWILVTLLPFLLGFGQFLLILWNTKIIIALCYLGSAWLIGRILACEHDKESIVGMVLFALNPLILIECLVSAHNDIVMITLALYAIYLSRKKHSLFSFFMYSFSIAMKLMTIFLFPAYIFRWNKWVSLIGMSIALILVCFQREILPWYFVWIVPFVALMPLHTELVILSAGISFGLLLRYAPYLYYGDWNSPVPEIKFWVTIWPIVISFCSILLYRQFVRKR